MRVSTGPGHLQPPKPQSFSCINLCFKFHSTTIKVLFKWSLKSNWMYFAIILIITDISIKNIFKITNNKPITFFRAISCFLIIYKFIIINTNFSLTSILLYFITNPISLS